MAPLRHPFFVGLYLVPRWFEMKMEGSSFGEWVYVAVFIRRRELVRCLYFRCEEIPLSLQLGLYIYVEALCIDN